MSAGSTAPTLFQHLKVTDAGKRRIDEVLAFLDKLDAVDHPLAKRARTEFADRIAYLDGYGGEVSETDATRRFQVTLGVDFTPLCFTITWRSLDLTTGEYLFFMSGGLVWHGGPHDPFVVSLDATVLWGIHT